MLNQVEAVGKAPVPDQAELDTLRGNVAKQQQKVEQLSTPQPSANGAEVLPSLLMLASGIRSKMMAHRIPCLR